QVMETWSVLIEPYVALLVWRTAHQNAGAAADAVDDVLAPDERLHRQEVAEPLPERHARCRVVDVELHVGDAVDLDGHERSFAADGGGGRYHRSGAEAGQRNRGGARDARAVVVEAAGRLTSAAGSVQRGAGKGRPVTEWDAQAYNRVSALQQWLAEKSLHR